MEIYYMPCFGMGHGFSFGRPRSHGSWPLTGGRVAAGLELLEARFGHTLGTFRGTSREGERQLPGITGCPGEGVVAA
jgi:hypothetical protein